jgi:hypothetical protein
MMPILLTSFSDTRFSTIALGLIGTYRLGSQYCLPDLRSSYLRGAEYRNVQLPFLDLVDKF